MSDVATSLFTKKYLNNLRSTEFDTNYYTAAIPSNPMEDRSNLNEPIIIEDEDDEESSDCEVDKIKLLADSIKSMLQRVNQVLQLKKGHKKSSFTDQLKKENQAEKDNPGEQSSSQDPKIFSSAVRLVDVKTLKPDTNLNLQKPQAHQSNTEPAQEKSVSENVTIQNVQNSSSSSNALRTLLENSIIPPKKRYHHTPQTIVRKTTGGVSIDLSGFSKSDTIQKQQKNVTPVTQPDQSSSHGKQMQINSAINPLMQERGEFSGGHSSFLQPPPYVEKNIKSTPQSTLNLACQSSQSAPQYVEKNIKPTTQSTLNLACQSSQSAPQYVKNIKPTTQSTLNLACQSSQSAPQYVKNIKPTTQSTLNLRCQSSQPIQGIEERSAVANRDPRISARNSNQNTPIYKQIYPNSSQHSQQINELPPQYQNPLTHGNNPDQNLQPQIVAQSFTKEQYVFQQIYSQNNAIPGHYLPPPYQCPTFLPQQENFNQNQQTEAYHPGLLYWAQIGMEMWARGNMPQNIPPAINEPIEYQPYLLPSTDQDMEALQETSTTNLMDFSNESVYFENETQNQPLVQEDFNNQLNTSVQNPMEENLLPVNINESGELDAPSSMIDIPASTNVTDDNEQSTNTDIDIPTTIENSQDTVNESANSQNAKELLQQLGGLFEQMKLRMTTINNQLKNKSLFDNSAIMDNVMKSVHDYCAQQNINVSVSTSQDASTANQRVVKRRSTSVDRKNTHYYDYELDEDYKADTEEDDSDNEPKRKSIKISFVLPPEYDPNDSRWTMLYRIPGFGLRELLKNSKVFVNERQLINCQRVAKTSNSLATMLLCEVFSYNALTICSLTGSRATSYQIEGNKIRPGLDNHARETLITYVQQHAEKVGWRKVSRNKIMDSMRFKLKCMRERALKFKE